MLVVKTPDMVINIAYPMYNETGLCSMAEVDSLSPLQNKAFPSDVIGPVLRRKRALNICPNAAWRVA